MLIKQIQSRPRHRYLWHNGQRFNSAVVYGRPLNHRPFDIRSYDIFFCDGRHRRYHQRPILQRISNRSRISRYLVQNSLVLHYDIIKIIYDGSVVLPRAPSRKGGGTEDEKERKKYSQRRDGVQQTLPTVYNIFRVHLTYNAPSLENPFAASFIVQFRYRVY